MRAKSIKRFLLIALVAGLTGLEACPDSGGGGPIDPIYRQRMRDFVQAIGAYAKAIHPGFLIIPQNGQELMVLDAGFDGTYLDLIDAFEYYE